MTKRLSFEYKQLIYVSLALLPSWLTALIFVSVSDISLYLKALIILLLSCGILASLYKIHDKLSEQFISFGNLIEALNHGDFTLRAKSANATGPQALLISQINQLCDSLASARFDYKEHQLLMAKLLKQVDAVIIATDSDSRITMANPAAERLLAQSQSRLCGQTLKALQLAPLDSACNHDLVTLTLRQQPTRWHLFKDSFREQARQHTLYILSDLELVISRQEHKAWQDLVRVLSHEVNNSLAPINSLSATLTKLVSQLSAPQEDKQDLHEGLAIIAERARRLHSFISGYKALSQLPAPQRVPCVLNEMLNGVIALIGHPVQFKAQPLPTLMLDQTQLEQCLINLFKNAVEAAPDKPIDCQLLHTHNSVTIQIRDLGPGIQNPDNLFIPLYTTKEHGTGVGLALARQIVQNHGGQLSLSNYQLSEEVRGCQVELRLPLAQPKN